MEGEKDGGSRGGRGGGLSGSIVNTGYNIGGKYVDRNNNNNNQSSSSGDVESPPPSPIADSKYTLMTTGGGGASEQARRLQLLYLFPRNYEFHKDEVIQLWIAQELVDTESSAGSYFKEFEELGVFQLSTVDYSAGQQQRYTLSDSSARLLVQKRSHEFFRIDDVNSEMSENTKHASFRDDDSISMADLYKAGRLTTLMILHMDGGPHLYQIPRDLFLNLPLLRVLDFSHTSLTDLPSSIGILKDLRNLNLSCTPITALPKSLCSLHHMQTLKLKGCTKLVGLPKGMKNLINLRHLEVDLDCLAVSMPPGLGDLIQLQTLPAFVVGEENGCHITELGNLVNLSGTLNILRLENVSSSEEAKMCALDNKKYLQNVVLHWTDCVDGFQVLENLQPHTQIEELQIVGYGGAEFPNWIGDCIFSRLATITLVDCKNCDLLPTLGQLPSLQCLSISDMHTVKNINSTFCGRNMAVSLSVPYNMFNAFQSLEKLTLNGMPMLETWSGIEKGQFPNLQKLCISHCPKLTSLPELSLLVSLQQLEISLCPSLEAFPDKGLPTSLQCLVIIESPGLEEVMLHKGGQKYWEKLIPRIWINYQQIIQGMEEAEAKSQIPQGSEGNNVNPDSRGYWQERASSASVVPEVSDHLLTATDDDESELERRKKESSPIKAYLASRAAYLASRAARIERVVRTKSVLDDGYRWRKYGYKPGRYPGPRSYYKCTSAGCPARKYVERAPPDLEYVTTTYEGIHNHESPAVRSTSHLNLAGGSSNAQASAGENASPASSITDALHSQQGQLPKSLSSPDSRGYWQERASSASVVPEVSDHLLTATDDDESELKRRKKESSPIKANLDSRAARRSRRVVHTKSEMDILDDGYRWRKYGQKPVKGNPNPRSYYKCTSAGCPARKHVERAPPDVEYVTTTYEGKHNHESPAVRSTSHLAGGSSNAQASAGENASPASSITDALHSQQGQLPESLSSPVRSPKS